MNSVQLAIHDPAQAALWCDVLGGSGQWLVLAPVRNFGAVRRSLAQLQPALLVSDLRLIDGTVVEIVRGLRSGRNPLGTQVLVLTHRADDDLLLHALQAGADNFVNAENASPAEWLQHAAETLSGGADIAPWIARRLLDHFGLRPSGKQRCAIEDLANPLVLTDPERQLLLQLSNGYRLGELARVEGVRPRELTGRVRQIYRKMQWQLRAGGLALQGG